MDSTGAQIGRTKAMLDGAAVAGFRRGCLATLQRAVDRTPLARLPWPRRGLLRGNWQATNGAPAIGTLERIDPSGTATVAEGRNEILAGPDRVEALVPVYLVNNLPGAQ